MCTSTVRYTSTDAGDRGTKIRKEEDVFVVVKNSYIYIIQHLFETKNSHLATPYPKIILPCIYVVLFRIGSRKEILFSCM
jgi:hypothetical protein